MNAPLRFIAYTGTTSNEQVIADSETVDAVVRNCEINGESLIPVREDTSAWEHHCRHLH